jgi:fermentation-respiration switch protein FrsA (DUF1100 family)
VEKLFGSGSIELAGHVARPRIAAGMTVPGLVLAHGFPDVNQGGRLSARSFPELADRIATEMGWMALVFTFRGCGDSEGNFSMHGWRDDMLAACAFLRSMPEVRDVAAMGAHADFDDWATHPRRLLEYARETTIIRSPNFPTPFEPWARQIREVSAVRAIRSVAPRPALIMHGSEDASVPVLDSRLLAEAHGSADVRIIDGGGHQLRHDPRAVAVLLGWLDRQRSLGSTVSASMP